MTSRRILDVIQKLPATIGQNGAFVGDLRGPGNYVVHGEVLGNGDVDGVLMLGPHCRWQGQVCADVVVVKGWVMGSVSARSKLELRAGAKVQGDITAPLIAIAQGAVVQGQVSGESVITHFVERRVH